MPIFEFVLADQFRVRLPKHAYEYPYDIQDCTPQEALDSPARVVDIRGLAEYFPAQFSERHALNTPGPIYCAATAFCTTGPQQAPQNVLMDEAGQEFVFRQPASATQFRNVVCAAHCDAFRGYGADGDRHWRLSLIREWWQSRTDMLTAGLHDGFGDPQSKSEWQEGLKGAYLDYLQTYAFFVENGRKATDDEALPSI